MGFMNSLLKFAGIDPGSEEEQDYYNDDFEMTAPVNTREREKEPRLGMGRRSNSKVLSLNDIKEITAQLKVVVMRPQTFEEAQDIADHLKSKKFVIINLGGIEKIVAKRIIDFLSGVVYALDGNIQKIDTGIFFIARDNVGVLDEEKRDFSVQDFSFSRKMFS